MDEFERKSLPLITITVADCVKPEIEEVELAGEPLDGVGTVIVISAAAVGCRVVPQLVELPRVAPGPAPVGAGIQEQIPLQSLQPVVVTVQGHLLDPSVQAPAFPSQAPIVRDIRPAFLLTHRVGGGLVPGAVDVPRGERVVELVDGPGRLDVLAVPQLPAGVVDELDEVSAVGHLEEGEDLAVGGGGQRDGGLDGGDAALLDAFLDLSVCEDSAADEVAAEVAAVPGGAAGFAGGREGEEEKCHPLSESVWCHTRIPNS